VINHVTGALNMVQAIGGLTDFTNKLINVMDEVEYRRITSAEDMEDVARLRHKAYKKACLSA